MSRVSNLKKDAPELLADVDVFNLADEADKLQDLKVLYDTDGGKQLVSLLIKDTKYGLQSLCSTYRTASHTELIALIAHIDAHWSTAKLLLSAEDGLRMLDSELENALRE
jgi:hypothetical protein